MAPAARIPALVRQLRSSSRVAQLQAAKALSAASKNGGEAAAEALVAAGGIPPLLRLLSCGSEAVQQEALWALYHLAAAHVSGRSAIIAAGGVPALVQLLEPESGTPPNTLRVVPLVLAKLALGTGPDPRPAFLAAGGVPALIELLSHSNADVQKAAMTSIQYMLDF